MWYNILHTGMYVYVQLYLIIMVHVAINYIIGK